MQDPRESYLARLITCFTNEVDDQVRPMLTAKLTLCIGLETDNSVVAELITIDSENLRGHSRKSSNAFLRLPEFIKTICSLVVEGVAAYQLPFLLAPIALHMIIETKELVTESLGQIDTAILLALWRLEYLKAEQLGREEVLIEANSILERHPDGHSLDMPLLISRSKFLHEIGCLSYTSKGGYKLAETVELTLL